MGRGEMERKKKGGADEGIAGAYNGSGITNGRMYYVGSECRQGGFCTSERAGDPREGCLRGVYRVLEAVLTKAMACRRDYALQSTFVFQSNPGYGLRYKAPIYDITLFARPIDFLLFIR